MKREYRAILKLLEFGRLVGDSASDSVRRIGSTIGLQSDVEDVRVRRSFKVASNVRSCVGERVSARVGVPARVDG